MGIRTERVAKLLQREVAAILARDFASSFMMTVTAVRVTKDLGIAYVQVSVMQAAKADREAAIAHLVSQTARVRGALGRRIRHQMRSVPELRFFLDETEEQAARIDALFESIREGRTSPSEQDVPGEEHDT